MEPSRAFLVLRTHFEVFGLEAHKSSKMSSPRLEDSTFFVSLKMSHGHDLFLLGKSAKTSRKIWKEFFFSGGRLKKILGNACALCSWPRESLSLALASKVASSTPPL